MLTMRRVRMWTFGVVLVLPLIATAQTQTLASLSGVVKDSSGAVLPGVTVEASSPAMIEKIRSVVTDGSGQYRIVDLRSGTYAVTFTLPGFSTFKREGIELAGSFNATVNAELRVGALEETITVTGDSPIIDTHNVRQQQVIDKDVIASLPTSRSFTSLAGLNPAIALKTNSGEVATNVGGITGPNDDRYVAHGSLVADARLQLDGLSIAAAAGGGTQLMTPVSTSQEIVVTTSGGLADVDSAGIQVNIVPREGGNAFHGGTFATVTNGSLQASNYGQTLKDKGLSAPNDLDKLWDINPSLGGPLSKDQLWFFLQTRHTGANNLVAGMFYNKNANDPTKWTYDPDPSRQAISDNLWYGTGLKLTWQATARNKFGVLWDEQVRCADCNHGGSPTTSPEASTKGLTPVNDVGQVTWTSPLSNRILLEAGFGAYRNGWGGRVRSDVNPAMIPVVEQGGAIPGLAYRAPASPARNWNGAYSRRASLSYVTGAHSLKFGYQAVRNDVTNGRRSLQGISYRFNNGAPNRLTETAAPFDETATVSKQGLYAQDQWTVQKFTIQAGVRYDHFSTHSPDLTYGGTQFVPTRYTFPARDGTRYNDVTARLGVAYDVFGNGRTAVKVNVGKYVVGTDGINGTPGTVVHPIALLATTTNRSWNDASFAVGDPRRNNFIPDCDLRNPLANGECGAIDNDKFGTNAFTVNYDPAILNGWGVRPYQWEFSGTIQQQLLPRVSATVGYFRRWYGNFLVTDNLATIASDYTLFGLPVPVDPRLANGGGVVTGVATINDDKFGKVDNQVTAASKFGQQTDRYDGVDASIDVRMRDGLVVRGGIGSGRVVRDNCAIARQLPEILGSTPLQYCHYAGQLQSQVKLLATYTIPRIDLQVSGTLQNIPGPEIQANYNAPNSVIQPIIGRALSGRTANQTVNVLAPLSTYADRINQLDVRAAKVLRFRHLRSMIGLDLYNAFNNDAVTTLNKTLGSSWLAPQGVLSARFAKISMQFDF